MAGVQSQTRDVHEIAGVQRPQCRAMLDCARRNRDVNGALSRPAHLPVDRRGCPSFIGAERNEMSVRGEHREMTVFVGCSRSAKPFVQRERRERDILTGADNVHQLGKRAARPGEGVEQQRSVEVNYQSSG